MTYDSRFNGLGRNEVEQIAADALQLVARLERDATQLTKNLTNVQTRCTALLMELRAYRDSGICLSGWWCPCARTDTSPGIFNGAGKEQLTRCRCCGAPRPT